MMFLNMNSLKTYVKSIKVEQITCCYRYINKRRMLVIGDDSVSMNVFMYYYRATCKRVLTIIMAGFDAVTRLCGRNSFYLI